MDSILIMILMFYILFSMMGFYTFDWVIAALLFIGTYIFY